MSTVCRRVAAVRMTDGAVLHAVVDGPDLDDRGRAPATLVLAHGWTLAQASWDDVAALLAPRTAAGELRLIRYDQRGHGRSTWASHPDARVSIDRLGHDLGELLDQLVPDGPAVLGGHSMGGMTIMCLAASHPELFGDRVKGTALVSTSAGDLQPAPRTRAERVRQRLTPAALAGAAASARLIEALRQKVPPAHPRHRTIVRGLLYGADATDDMVLAGAEIMHAATVRAFTEFLPALGAHDKHAELEALRRVPVEILVGDSDKLTPQRHSRRLAEVLPEARLHVAERTGHMLLQERPRLVADAIGRLLAAATGDRAAA